MRKPQSYYEHQPRGIYTRQRANARRREIPFDITFEEWKKVWEDSGKWEQRGTARGCFCMSRINDEGGYSLGNVEIKSVTANIKEHLDKRWVKEQSDPFRTHPRTSAWDYGRKEKT